MWFSSFGLGCVHLSHLFPANKMVDPSITITKLEGVLQSFHAACGGNMDDVTHMFQVGPILPDAVEDFGRIRGGDYIARRPLSSSRQHQALENLRSPSSRTLNSEPGDKTSARW